jgi:polysaccharide export outer membrane protein
MKRLVVLLIALAGQLYAQAYAGGAAPAAPIDTGKQVSLPAPINSMYVIGAEDTLSIVVWKEPELSSVVPVRSDGKISLPLLDDVQAAGLTPTQLAGVIRDRASKFLTNPRVTVIVTAMNSKKVFLVGQVVRPGAIPLLSEMTVLQALSTCGGTAQFANTKKIYILRNEGGQQKKLEFNMEAVLRGKNAEQNRVLKPGDTIVVP